MLQYCDLVTMVGVLGLSTGTHANYLLIYLLSFFIAEKIQTENRKNIVQADIQPGSKLFVLQ